MTAVLRRVTGPRPEQISKTRGLGQRPRGGQAESNGWVALGLCQACWQTCESLTPLVRFCLRVDRPQHEKVWFFGLDGERCLSQGRLRKLFRFAPQSRAEEMTCRVFVQDESLSNRKAGNRFERALKQSESEECPLCVGCVLQNGLRHSRLCCTLCTALDSPNPGMSPFRAFVIQDMYLGFQLDACRARSGLCSQRGAAPPAVDLFRGIPIKIHRCFKQPRCIS
jgi:hypothetical protein